MIVLSYETITMKVEWLGCNVQEVRSERDDGAGGLTLTSPNGRSTRQHHTLYRAIGAQQSSSTSLLVLSMYEVILYSQVKRLGSLDSTYRDRCMAMNDVRAAR